MQVARKVGVWVLVVACALAMAVGVWSMGSAPQGEAQDAITLGQWQAVRGMGVMEDSRLWDCRIMGNGTCEDAWYELVCPSAPQTPDLVCALERHPIGGTERQ